MNSKKIISKKYIRALIFERLKECLNIEISSIHSDTLIVPTLEPEFFHGYWIHVFSKYGQTVVDGGVQIYWRVFSEINDQMSAAAPYPTVPLKKWEMSAVIEGFDKLTNDWPNGGKIVSNIDEAEKICDEICHICSAEGKLFLERCDSPQHLLDYISNLGPDRPGAWRPTLDFLLRERLHGVEAACQHLKASHLENGTGYERHQLKWLLENRCGKRQGAS